MNYKITYNERVYQQLPEEDQAAIQTYTEKLADKVRSNAEAVLSSEYTCHPNNENLKLNNWYLNCWEYFNSFHTEQGEQIPSSLYMAYGYAVEELTNQCHIAVCYPYSLVKQVRYGNSICDYELRVYRRGNKTVILAWFDITSSANEDHIWQKSGGRWHSAPCACEIYYKPLEPRILLDRLNRSIGQNAQIQHGIRIADIENRKRLSYLTDCMRKIIPYLLNNHDPNTYRQIPDLFRMAFLTEMPWDHHIICHGLLVLFVKESTNQGNYLVGDAKQIINYYYHSHRYHDIRFARDYLECSYRQHGDRHSTYIYI